MNWFPCSGGGSGSTEHNYSTTEQAVGTWIDGSTIYEKTIHKSNSQSTFVDFEDIETIPNTNEMLSIEFIAKRELQNNEYLYYTGCGSVMPEYSNDYKISTRFYNSNLQYYIAGYGTQITDLWITIRYTKTSA